MPGEESDAHGRKGHEGIFARPLHTARRILEERLDTREGYAPLDADDAAEVVHEDPRRKLPEDEYERWMDEGGLLPQEYDGDSDEESLGFGTPEGEDEELFDDARRLEFGSYFFPLPHGVFFKT